MNEMLRNMPQTDELLKHIELSSFYEFFSHGRIKETVRLSAEALRKKIIAGELAAMDRAALGEKIIRSSVKRLRAELQEQSNRLINGTGVIIHTNLGRSPLSKEAAESALSLSSGYSNLEYSAPEGKRRNRLTNLEKILVDITGAEAAVVVNNNAAAVFLALNTLCKNKEVIVSRGELVEIGDSFRVSEIVEASGCIVKEVGATNKTHRADVERALSDNTALLLKMHTSNFKIVGFSGNVEAKELTEIGKSRNIPVMEDMGSGVLFDLRELGLKGERTVQEAVKDNVDIISFSGDKMLGGPQAGIIVGKKRYIDQMRRNQLLRCLRIDKTCIFALEATLRQYFKKEDILRIPIYKMMAMPLETVKERAERLKAMLENSKLKVEVRAHLAQFGGGSLPFEYIDSYAVYLASDYITTSTIDSFFRRSKTPVIGTVQNNEYILDLRTLEDEDFSYLSMVSKEMFE